MRCPRGYDPCKQIGCSCPLESRRIKNINAELEAAGVDLPALERETKRTLKLLREQLDLKAKLTGQAWPVVETGEGAGTESITSVPFSHDTGGIWESVEYFHQIGSNGKQNVGAVCKRVDAVTWVWTVYIFPGTGGSSKIVIEQGSGRSRDECLDSAHSVWKTECEKR